jgi:hypothetical protein
MKLEYGVDRFMGAFGNVTWVSPGRGNGVTRFARVHQRLPMRRNSHAFRRLEEPGFRPTDQGGSWEMRIAEASMYVTVRGVGSLDSPIHLGSISASLGLGVRDAYENAGGCAGRAGWTIRECGLLELGRRRWRSRQRRRRRQRHGSRRRRARRYRWRTHWRCRQGGLVEQSGHGWGRRRRWRGGRRPCVSRLCERFLFD